LCDVIHTIFLLCVQTLSAPDRSVNVARDEARYA